MDQINSLLGSLWPLAVWAALYISDYYLTLACAKLYQASVKEKIVFEGSYELNPYYQKDIDSLRSMSPRFFRTLLLVLFFGGTVWGLARQAEMAGAYVFLLGVLILLQLVIHHRHLRNLLLFRAIAKNGLVRGRIEYSRRQMIQQSALEFLAFAGLFAFLYFATNSLFVLGGVVACFLTAVKHWQLARKEPSGFAAAQTQ